MKKVLFVVFLIAFFAFPCRANAEWDFFTTDVLYENPLSYPRSPQFSLNISMDPDRADIQASLGKSFGLATWDDKVQFGLEAGTWFTLVHNEGSAFNLISDDYIVSFPIMFRLGSFTGAIKYNHISAHLGDGAKGIIGEVKDGVYSREFVSYHMTINWKAKDASIDSHFHAGYLLVVMPEHLGNYFVGTGLSIAMPNPSTPYLSVDLTYNDDVRSLDLSYMAGIMFRSDDISIGAGATGYLGSDRRGRLYYNKVSRIGVGVWVR